MAKRKKRTSIRTAAGVAQEKYLEKVRALADDPMRVLPEVVGDEPKSIAKLRKGIEKVAGGKIGFFDKRDKGVLGAVAQSLPLAELESVPRLLDTKVAGKRRFFLTRGHVGRGCMLGVQNHDEPKALLMAYRDMAKVEGLHFFATPRLWCTGSTPQPPEEWLEAIAKKTEAPLHETETGWVLGDASRPRVRLGFRGGPTLDIDPRATSGHVHQLVGASYAGPRQRHPVEVHTVMPDGSVAEPGRDMLAQYRAGVTGEKKLLDATVATWRKEQRGSAARRFVLGEQDYGDDHDAFIAALGPDDWEEPALRALTEDGFVGRAKTAADVFQASKDRIDVAVRALHPAGAQELLAQHGHMPPRDLIRKAHDAAEEARVHEMLPSIKGGAETTLIDAIAHASLRGRSQVLDVIRKALDAGKVPPGHIAAFLEAAGGDVSLASRIDADAAATGTHLAPQAEAVLAARGKDYPKAVQAFLQAAGSAEA